MLAPIREGLCSWCSLCLKVNSLYSSLHLTSIDSLDCRSTLPSSEVSSLTRLLGYIPSLISCMYPWWHFLQMQYYMCIINWLVAQPMNQFISFPTEPKLKEYNIVFTFLSIIFLASSLTPYPWYDSGVVNMLNAWTSKGSVTFNN